MGNVIGYGRKNSPRDGKSIPRIDSASGNFPAESVVPPPVNPLELPTPVNFCKNQCRVLNSQLSDAEEILSRYPLPRNSRAASSADLCWPQLALLELRRLVNVGRTLIEGCQNETCLKAYLRQGARTLAFSEVVKGIAWCTSVVFYYGTTVLLSGNPAMTMDEFPLPRLGAYKELYALKKAAMDDQVELVNTLDTWIEYHVCSTEECGGHKQLAEDPPLCIAIQISERRKEEKSRNGGNIAGINVSSAVDHTTVSWNINRKILKEGAFLGRGAFGEVSETTWLGDTYARKMYRMDEPSFFINEANAMSKLNHPHMVTISAYSMGSQEYSILMERMTHDLCQYMRKRQREYGINHPPFSVVAAVDLMLQGAEAMMYVHSQGMVHRDLKASNILVKPVDSHPELSGHGFVIAKLADFGNAMAKRDVTAYSHLTKHQGTRGHMAPEVYEADADNAERLMVAYPKKADVYSFGIVCSEILTGKSPYYTFRMNDLYKLLTDSEKPLRPELPDSCPESLASLICDCWHTNPLKRPEFTEICTVLRYLKGLLMLTDDGQLKPWMVTVLQSVMAHVKQVSSITNPYSLFYTTFDGSSWTTALPLPHAMASPNGMSLADHNGTLVGIHRAAEHSKFCRSLCWSMYNGSTWTSPAQMIDSQISPSRPAVATFRDRLYCLYRGEDNEIWCTSAGPNLNNGPNLNDGWTEAVNAGGSSRTCDGPALVQYGDRLISVIRGMDDKIYWNAFDGSTWSKYKESRGNTTGSPAAAVYNDTLYVCVRNVDEHGSSGLYWFKLLEQSSYSKVDCNFSVLSGPSLAVFNDQLVCTLHGPGGQLYHTTFDGLSSWSPVSKIPSQYSRGEQGLCAFKSELVCVYGSLP